MARRRRKKLPQEPIECEIVGLSHEGRGIAKLDGKTQFVEGALSGERVNAVYIDKRASFDELKTIAVLDASPERVEPPCVHAALCGGCSLQHIDTGAQIRFKQNVLREQFEHFGSTESRTSDWLSAVQWIEPMTGPTEGYRGKARLGVRYVTKRDEVLVGFREKRNSFIADIERCEVLDPRIGQHLMALRKLVASLSVYQALPQFEVAMGDERVALVIRHMEPLTDDDQEQLLIFAKAHDFDLYLQSGGPKTVCKIWPEDGVERLTYCLPLFDNGRLDNKQPESKREVTLSFHPMDFTQVNADINRKMVRRAIDWLDLQSTDRVLDLFCGLGNFTLPMATVAKQVVGVEGDESMVVRGRENATLNALDNVEFHGANLQADFTQASWAQAGFDKILIDPPRSGALDVVNYLAAFGAKRIVYVSCNPATLARDSGVLVDKGYRMLRAGVMDMFPHTAHVESIALFERSE